MKVSIFWIPDFPFGKKTLPDERLHKMQEWFRSQKITEIQVEFTTEKDLKAADAVVCPHEKKLDLIILDMEVLESRLEKELTEQEKTLMARCQKLFEKETPLCEGGFSEEEKKWLTNNNLVTIKPVIFVSREEMENLPALTRKVYDQAGMISFLTGCVKESRVWELKKNTTAVEAAGAIHSDMARGFIRAEVIKYGDLIKVNNVNQAKSEEYLRQEGKDYIVEDGDIIEFKFSV